MTDNIYVPQFELTAGIQETIDAIDRERWLVDSLLIMPKYEEWIHRSVRTRRVAATTAIEQLGIGEEAVDELARKGARGRPDELEQANLNALRAYEFVDYVSDQNDIPVDELVVRELNRVFMRDTADALTPGVYRKGQNEVYNFMPPNSGDVPGLMRGFATWLREEDDSVHPILRAGLAHIHFVAIHPFWDGNGRTARAVMTTVLQRSKFGFRKLLSPESEFADRRDEYLTAIERTLGTEFRQNYDATRWLEFYTTALFGAVTKLTIQLTDWRRLMDEMHTDFQQIGISNRETDGLAYALHKGRITRGDYIEITGISPMTASRDLAHLVEAGVFIAHGKTRNRFYVPRLGKESSDENSTTGNHAQLPLELDDQQGVSEKVGRAEQVSKR